MSISALPVRQFCLGLAYFVAASLAIAMTRYDGGIAFLWVASSLLIAELMTRPRRHWMISILPCALSSFLATAWYGFGWVLAIPFVAINIIEAVVAAWAFRRRASSLRTLGSLAWLMHFTIAVGLIAPLVAAILASATLWTIGKPLGPVFLHYFAGHALGNLTFTPLALLFARGHIQKTLRDLHRRDGAASFFLLLAVVGTSAFVFWQSSLPLLFLPVLPIIIVTFRLGRGGSAAAIVILALIGGAATMAGLGPIHLMDASLGSRIQFFQFYLAATVLTVLPIAADLQYRQRLHRDLRLSEERYRLMAEHSTDILLHLEVDGRIRYVSPSIQQLGGHDPEALIGRNSSILVAPEHLERVREAHLATAAARGHTRTFDYLAVKANGTKRWFETHGRAILDEDGEVDGVICVVRDISARKATELRLSEDALTDPLTGLPNLRAFRLAIERRPREAGVLLSDCLAVFDIDHFKVINDSFGHSAGDEVLRGFAKIARTMVRDGDVIARVGGEEFAIFLPDTAIEQAMAVCDRLRAEIASTNFRLGSSVVRMTVSGGVSQIGPDGIDQAMTVADQALYRAKRNGRDQLALAA